MKQNEFKKYFFKYFLNLSMKFNCKICNQHIDNNKHIYRYKDTTYCSLCCIETVLLRDNNKELYKLLKSKITIEKQIKSNQK